MRRQVVKLDAEVLKKIEKVAGDKEVQNSIVSAFFDGCENGTDLWEWLEEDKYKYSSDTVVILFGSLEANDADDTHPTDCLYMSNHPHEVITELTKTVEKKIKERV